MKIYIPRFDLEELQTNLDIIEYLLFHSVGSFEHVYAFPLHDTIAQACRHYQQYKHGFKLRTIVIFQNRSWFETSSKGSSCIASYERAGTHQRVPPLNTSSYQHTHKLNQISSAACDLTVKRYIIVI